ncbi:MAG: methylthioribulose 1-phosphate dehydratase [Janthinobacterium lividum]
MAGEVPGWAVERVVAAGRRMDARGWVPATAGNISVRLDGARMAITRSGGHKGFLDAAGVMVADLDGRAVTEGARPSAEALLHGQVYRAFPAVGAVLHGHSVAATVLSMAGGSEVVLASYEVLKVFEGVGTHDVSLSVPVVENDQDIARLAGVVAVGLAGMRAGYLIRGHGVYVWGADMEGAMARLEGLEFLLACELERRKLR